MAHHQSGRLVRRVLPDSHGGDMSLSVTIWINDRPVITRSARNVTKVKYGAHDQVNAYRVDDGRTVEHLPSDGCVKLAIKLLEGVVEP